VRTLVVICQAYPPDCTAVGQHVADVANAMRVRGWRVIVYAASRDYEDPAIRYESELSPAAVEVTRLPWSSFGKRSIAIRLLAQIFFLVQAMLRAVTCRRVDAVLVSTSPPLAGPCGALISLLRRSRLVWWAMDLNPDQMVRLGKLRPSSPIVRLFDRLNRLTLKQADEVIVLDRYMCDRLAMKLKQPRSFHVLPPWAPPDCSEPIAHASNRWRNRIARPNARVVMYSGNHGLTSPLDTLLEALATCPHATRLQFAFVGGGVRKREIDQWIAATQVANVVSMPYQPLEMLPQSLSAADVHVVSVAAAAVGVSHSCKIYGALALGRPLLVLAPVKSHAADIVNAAGCGWLVEHGDGVRMREVLKEIADASPGRLEEMGERGRRYVREFADTRRLIASVCAAIEGGATSMSPRR